MEDQMVNSRVDTKWHSFISPFRGEPVYGEDDPDSIFTTRPIHPLLLPNNSSEARDHCANERTFLSWLRLAVYMSVVSCAIVLTFHLRSRPSDLERQASLPLGIIFWILSLCCLTMGVVNYVRTVKMYAQRRALVQSGWGTHIVFATVAAAIVAACVLFLILDVKRVRGH